MPAPSSRFTGIRCACPACGGAGERPEQEFTMSNGVAQVHVEFRRCHLCEGAREVDRATAIRWRIHHG